MYSAALKGYWRGVLGRVSWILLKPRVVFGVVYLMASE